MEEHVAHVYVGGPTEESNTRKFLTNLSFKNVRQINTVKFTCLLNNKEDNSKEVTKEEFLGAIDKYLNLSDEEQLELLKKCCTFVGQQSKLNSYKKDIAYYTTQKENLEKKHEELLATQENVNSPEYIEKIAREELDMYLPNETVYIDVSK